MSIELEPLPAKRILAYIFLAIALVLLPSIITTKRVEVNRPTLPRAEITSLGAVVYAVEQPTPEKVAEPVVEPPQEQKPVETVRTPPPVEKPATEPPVQPKAVEPPAITGTKQQWLEASNIPRKDWENVDWLVSRESSWRPNAQNPNSTAYGLKQFLDSTWAGVGCTKEEAINNPVYQLNCGHRYVMNRYGTWEAAVIFWRAHHWY